jgi:hypothetical protein
LICCPLKPKETGKGEGGVRKKPIHHCPLRAFSCALASRAARTKGASVERSTHVFMNSCYVGGVC